MLVGLVGCASSAESSVELGAGVSSELSLVETKSPVQLLRNDVASRVPKIAIKGVAELADSSIACGGPEDVEGLARSWRSTATFLVSNSRVATIDGVIASIAAEFTERDWSAEVNGGATVLSSDTSPATISIEAVHRGEGKQPAIRIATSGPCVETDGENSDEVKELEGRA